MLTDQTYNIYIKNETQYQFFSFLWLNFYHHLWTIPFENNNKKPLIFRICRTNGSFYLIYEQVTRPEGIFLFHLINCVQHTVTCGPLETVNPSSSFGGCVKSTTRAFGLGCCEILNPRKATASKTRLCCICCMSIMMLLLPLLLLQGSNQVSS